MSAAGLSVELRGFDPIQGLLARLSAHDTDKLLDKVGAEAESETRRRIHEEKSSPDGTPWPDWTDAYKNSKRRRRRSGGKLELSGHLLDSIEHDPGAWDEEIVGSPLKYSAAQNWGFEENHLPARAFLGISSANVRELLAVVNDWYEHKLEGR